MRVKSNWVIFILFAFAMLMMGCEGKEGKIGPAGLNGQNGPNGSVFEYTYAGNDVMNCTGCHSDKIAGWQQTAHASATTNLFASSPANETNPLCLKCHTTGYDSIDHYGYDDALANHDSVRLAALSNVQCEACHGAYYQRDPQNFADAIKHQYTPANASLDDHLLTNGTSPSLCNKCHGTQIQAEWATSLHGMMFDSAVFGGYNGSNMPWNDSTLSLEWVRNASYSSWNNVTIPGQTGNCWECHTAEGFIHANNPLDHLTQEAPSRAHMVGCATCHDPHGVELASTQNPQGNLFQLRNTSDFAVIYFNPNANMTAPSSGAYGARPKGTNAVFGASMVCAECHHDRTDTAAVRGQIQSGNSRFGPHHSTQFDMLVGGGSFEIDSLTLRKVDSALCAPNTPATNGTYVKYYNQNRTTAHQTRTDADGRAGCVMCHMPDVVDATVTEHTHASHTFAAQLPTCATGACHNGAPSFASIIANNGGHAGNIDSLAAVLRSVLPADSTTWGTGSSVAQVKIHKAVYPLKFVEEDRSHGVHNPEYTQALLTNAIAYIRSSIP